MNGKKANFKRRDFIKYGLGGLTVVSLTPIAMTGKTGKSSGLLEQEKKIIWRTLGSTGLTVPVVSLGCGFVDEPGLVRAALEAGITHFDTAPGYGGGKSEPVLGEVLKTKKRDSFILASKIGLPADNRTGNFRKNISRQEFNSYFLSQLNTRLELLQTDYLDILYIYDAGTPEMVAHHLVKEALTEAKKSGKTRFIGASFHRNEPAMIQACMEQKIYDVILTAYNFRQPHREQVRQAIARAATAGMGVVAMKFFAGVYWDRERRHPINPRAALKWLIQDENVHTVAVGMKSFDQVEQNVSVMADPVLTPEEKKDLKLDEALVLGGLYCAQCQKCRSQCRHRLNIPLAMRAYMYAYGYRETALAKQILIPTGQELLLCRTCGSCSVACTQGFDVGKKMKDIIRILPVPDEFLV